PCSLLRRHSMLTLTFFSSSSAHHRDLHSFPNDALPIFPRKYKVMLSASTYSRRYRAAGYYGRCRNLQPQWSRKWCAYAPLRRLRSEEHTSELQSRFEIVCRLLLEKKNMHCHGYQTLQRV